MPPPPPLPTTTTNTTTGDDDDYVSPYATTTDERLRRSVMAALPDGAGAGAGGWLLGRRSAFSSTRGRGAGGVFRPVFEGEAFLSALGIVGVVVEGVLVSAGEERGDGYGFGEGGRGARVVGGDRATNSLYEPLENLECMVEAFRGEVEAWANKPKYFREVTVPFIVRTIETSTSEASTLKKLRRALKFAGPIDDVYVNSFDPFVRALEEPILELRALGDFIEGVLRGEGEGLNVSTTTMMVGGMRSGESVRRGEGAGGSGGEVREKKATAKTSSKYFDTILNPEVTTQASSRSGDVRMEGSAARENDDGMGSSAFADLLRAAGYLGPDLQDMKSPSPRHETEPTDLADAGSPSYSPPAAPSLSFGTLLQHTDPPATTRSSILSNPTPTIHYAPNDAHKRTVLLPPPSGPPRWKLDLHARKGHPVHLLHAGPRQLAILTRCGELVQTATRKGEECVRRIEELKALSGEMRGECEQWGGFCADLEGNVMMEMEMEDEDGEGDVAREYGRLDDRDGVGAWGYRKFDGATAHERRKYQHLAGIDENDDQDGEDAETDVEDWRKDTGRSDRFPVHHHRSGPDPGPGPRSSRIQGSNSPSSSSEPSSSGHNDTRTAGGTARKQKQKPTHVHVHAHARSKAARRKGHRARCSEANDGDGDGDNPDREVSMVDADADAETGFETETGGGDEMEWESTEDDGEDGDEGEKGEKGLRSAGGGVVGLYG